MNDKNKDQDSFRALQLMNELENGQTVSQRELASRLGIAVGLVNSYIKNFVAKGYVRIKNYPRNRYAYLLTPKGFTEKTRLAYSHLHYFTGLYTSARQDYFNLFRRLKETGGTTVAFCGVDEVAEIAYLSLQEAGLNLTVVIDEAAVGKNFFGYSVLPMSSLQDSNCPVVVTSFKNRRQLKNQLMLADVDPKRILELESTR